jgi:hypothetical protein
VSVQIERGGVISAYALPDGITTSGTHGHEQPTGPSLASPILDDAAADELFTRLRAAGRAFRARPVADRITALGRAAERLLDPDDPLRREALRLLPGNAALSEEAASGVLDRMAADWTRDRLAGVVASEFPGGALEPDSGEDRLDPAGRRVRRIVSSPELVLTICSGTVPGVSTTAVLRSLLVGAGTLVKPGAGDVVLPVLFAKALRDIDPEAADALAVAYWSGGDAELEDAALAAVDRVVVYGGDETVRSVRRRTPPDTTLVEYRHRVGIVVVGAGGRDEQELERIADDVAESVVPYEQRGCVSPVRVHAVGTRDDAVRFGTKLADRMERRSATMPGRRTPEEAAAAQQLVGSLELRRAAGESVDLWAGRGWAVAVESVGEPFAGGRVIMVRATDSVEKAASALMRWRGRLQAVGTAGLAPEAEARIARAAAAAGASRVGPVHAMAYPPPWWIHDGRGPLHALVDLMEWERTD